MPVKNKNERYYCRNSNTSEGHCDDHPMTIQCSECIDMEKEIVRENPYQHYYGWNKPID